MHLIHKSKIDKAKTPAKNSHQYYSVDKKAFFFKLTINGHLQHSFIQPFLYISNHFWYYFAGGPTLGCVKKPKMLKNTNVPPSCETID